MQRTPGPLLFGTSLNGDATARLTRLAIECGFRGFDSALRPHYDEAAVGNAVAGAIRDGIVQRDDLFLQTKFTPDLGLSVPESFAVSLARLHVETIDSYLLHWPDLAAWRAMESLPARFLGVCNVTLAQIEELCRAAAVPPAFVQNRCRAATKWNADVRAFCRANGIVYQAYSLIRANPDALRSASVLTVAARLKRTPAQVILRFAQQIGIVPLVGTTTRAHMEEALALGELDLTEEELAAIEGA